MTKDVQDAIERLAELHREVTRAFCMNEADRVLAQLTLARAIRHLAYPDRAIYPKTRRGTKGAPIVRK